MLPMNNNNKSHDTSKNCGSGDYTRNPIIQKSSQRDIFPQVKNNSLQASRSIKHLKKFESATGNVIKKTPNKSTNKTLCSKSLTDLCVEHINTGSNRRKKLIYTQNEIKKMGKSSPLAPNESSRLAETSNTTRLTADDSLNTTEAVRRIQRSLMLNAWRKRRHENKQLHDQVEKLLSQVDSLQMQIFVLRQLLETEKSRVSSSNTEVIRVKGELEKLEGEKRDLENKKTELTSCIASLEERFDKLKTDFMNQTNQLDAAVNEAKNWEKQLEKEREKLAKLKNEKKHLIEEVQSKEDLLIFKTRKLDKLTESNKELHAQVSVCEETMSELESARLTIRKQGEVLKDQEEKMKERKSDIEHLKETISLLENELCDRDTRNGELGKSVNDKTQELEEVQRKLTALTEMERKWGRRMVQVTSLFAKVPAACLYTLALLLVPRPASRGFYRI